MGGASGKAARIEWTTPILEAFEGSKQQMVRAAYLAHPGKKARLALSIDASGTHVGAALRQEVSPGSLQSLRLFSRKLNTAEQKYSAFDRELLLQCILLSVILGGHWRGGGSKCCQTTRR